jgi:hypothetical protein
VANDFDRYKAPELLGTHVLVGITKVDRVGKVVEQKEFHGHVVRATAREGVVIVNSAGKELNVPPDSRAFEVAEPGEYRLHSTGEIVVDPDYVATWTLTPPEDH